MRPFLTASCLAIAGLLVAVSILQAGTAYPSEVESLFAEHCYDCHDGESNKGDLNLETLGFSFGDPGHFKTWVRILDRVGKGEMPPQKKPRPKTASVRAFKEKLEPHLHAFDHQEKLRSGKVHVRRLTRREYEYTIQDLLAIDIPLMEYLPEESARHGFETVADSQQISLFNLSGYLNAADFALEEAFKLAFEQTKPYKQGHTAEQLCKKGGGNFRGPEYRKGESISYPISLQFYGRLPATEVPETGWYRITLKNVRAINPKGGQPVWGTLRSGTCYSSAPMLYTIGAVEAVQKKRDIVFEAWIRKGHMLELKPLDATLKKVPTGARGGNVSYVGRDLVKQGAQGIALSDIEIERVHSKRDPVEIRQRLLSGHPASLLETLQSRSQQRDFLYQTVGRFAYVAFRRPVTAEQAAPYIRLAHQELQRDGATLQDALKAAYRAILCSPRLLTFHERPGLLDDHALASRLSYALWNSMPDWHLRQLADQGRLRDPGVFHVEVDRLLDHPHAKRFIESFTDQWLNLKDIEFTSPDTNLYRTFDPIVQSAMLEETRGFFREILLEDLSITNFVASDFSHLNERLARFYGLDGLDLTPGNGMQKVKLGKAGRGGLVTHGSVLKVTANGTTTSPVVRGVWVAERILGMEIPPPPADVPAVEPDIRGAKSIREQLAKHRDNESCSACHRKIDPAGFALENYDPVGLWRSKYGKSAKGVKVAPQGITPGGESFANIFEWKKIYRDRPQLLTHGFAKHFLTYATGAEPSFSDRAGLDGILQSADKQGHRLRHILHSALASSIFKTK